MILETIPVTFPIPQYHNNVINDVPRILGYQKFLPETKCI